VQPPPLVLGWPLVNAVWIPASDTRTGDCWRESLDQTWAHRVTRKPGADGRVRLEYDDGFESGFIELAPSDAIQVIR
jgi:hypothetical protein